MKLDRNTNKNGHGKYALVNMRKLIPILDKWNTDDTSLSEDEHAIVNAFQDLHREGVITLGNETPGDQFFVMKYKDKFTARGLSGYADAVWEHYAELMHSPEMMDRVMRVAGGEKLNHEELGAAQAHHLELKSIRQYAEEMFEQAREAANLGNRIPD